MGCFREEGLHLSSFHECKIDMASLLELKKICGFMSSCVVIVFVTRSGVARVVSSSTKPDTC